MCNHFWYHGGRIHHKIYHTLYHKQNFLKKKEIKLLTSSLLLLSWLTKYCIYIFFEGGILYIFSLLFCSRVYYVCYLIKWWIKLLVLCWLCVGLLRRHILKVNNTLGGMYNMLHCIINCLFLTRALLNVKL